MSRSEYLKEELERAQLELIAPIRPDEKREVYELKRDVPTRWNSFNDMAERALYLQPAIEAVMIKVKVQYTQQKRPLPAVFQDELNDNDWSVIKAYHDILKPIKKATTLLQGHARGRFGCIWQVLPIYKQLLTHFEKLRGQYLPIESMKQSNENSVIFDNLSFNDSQYFTQEAVDQQLPQEQFISHQHHFATYINLGWQKLNHYYSLLDETPVYVAAIVLHPAMKWRFIEESWSNLGKREWIRTAKKAFNDLLNEATVDQLEELEAAAPPPPQISANTTNSSDDFFSEAFTIADEADDLEAECTIFEQLQEFIKDVSHRKAVIPAIKNRPLHTGLTMFDSPVRYWIDNRSRWPQLARLALDIYSTPAMSDEPERQFSTSGALVEPRRRLLSDTTIRNLMCVRSWIASSIVTLSRTFFGRSELKPAPSSATSADVWPYLKPPIVTID